ncbi:hypothetical protein T02_74 [Trichinella nativa]|uniref:Uncharacterized protein n=1 Tax=Trichinella nativa TaxID=6335 RepID=A0A0V1LLC3_9BILA|nr:hypothetical protein T02_74 [Trichinella nativa]
MKAEAADGSGRNLSSHEQANSWPNSGGLFRSLCDPFPPFVNFVCGLRHFRLSMIITPTTTIIMIMIINETTTASVDCICRLYNKEEINGLSAQGSSRLKSKQHEETPFERERPKMCRTNAARLWQNYQHRQQRPPLCKFFLSTEIGNKVHFLLLSLRIAIENGSQFVLYQ